MSIFSVIPHAPAIHCRCGVRFRRMRTLFAYERTSGGRRTITGRRFKKLVCKDCGEPMIGASRLWTMISEGTLTDSIPPTYDKHVASSLAGLNLGVVLISSSMFKHGRVCVNDKFC